MIRSFINSQRWLSRNFDRLLPMKYRLHGSEDFIKALVPKYLRENAIIYDIGGGKNPYLSPDRKKCLNATVFGLDIDKKELCQAHEGSYDKIICTDIGTYQGNSDADIVLCHAVLEHVKSTNNAFKAISSILKPGGLALIFVPSRNAVFARLNMLLPQNMKKAILHTIYPKTVRNQGFPSYYDKCTPMEFRKLADSNNLHVVEERFYFISSYFSFFFPAYLLWRLWVLLFSFIKKEQAAETFALVLRKD